MTSLVATESVTVVDDISVGESEINCCKNRQRRHILKSKENTYKHKCNKVLRRKLKKYKLRQDGQEDQDILDVSKILVSSLIIKSPNNRKQPILGEGDTSEFEDLRPRNYLFKMVRRKEAVKISESLRSSVKTDVKIQDETIAIPLSDSSQEKKQTNAFKLLMDSRNKSLGSNSPGKDKSNDISDSEEVVERKNNKAKRHLLLQKMAEAKGSLRNKEKEEYQDNIIKKQLEKRAENFKSMILKEAKSKENESTTGTVPKTDEKKSSPKDKVKVVPDNKKTKKQTQTLTIVDIFNTIEDPVDITSRISPVKKFIPKEDQEFLNKLSPSLKKKESMLCYFKKLDKDPESSPANSENDNLIKVKLQPRNKKRGKKKKLSLIKKDTLDCDLKEIIEDDTNEPAINITEENSKPITKENMRTQEEDNVVHAPQPTLIDSVPLNDIIEVEDPEVKNERQKRKRKSKVDAKVTDSDNTNAIVNIENRPKRCVKRPVKYIDDVCLSSSDEELHIFTPKKSKHVEVLVNDKKPVLKSNHSFDEPMKSKPVKKEEQVLKDAATSKKPAKLAPIFAPKQSDLAALEAKQKFLQSGVPEQLKKIIQQQKNCITPDNNFPVVVHVLQSDMTSEENPLVINIPMMNISEETFLLTYENNAIRNLLYLKQENSQTVSNIDNKNKKSTQKLLQNLKQLHPKFPVYRTYRHLRGRGKGEFKDCNYVDVDNSIEIISDMVDVINDSPDRLNWTDKYKATSTNQIIGNFETIKELRKWLVSWTENELKSKTKSKPGSDSSDFYQSESDSRESMKTMNNLLVLTGPTGCGKTASVYAVASDLAMKVIEVNASSRRTGKIMLQHLQEATQSHKVNRGTGNSDNSQKSQEKLQPDLVKKNKKRGRPKKSNDGEKPLKLSGKAEVLSGAPLSQESTRTDSSLILIDDADIVFDQDDGFSSAIVQLVQCSKRPVILITSSLVCPHLQRFLQNGKLLKMSPLLPRMLGTWLDILCLADSGICWSGVGAKFLNYFKGDIRKTINYLQFCIPSYVHGITSEDETASQNIDFYKSNIDEESSCPSWAENDDSEGRIIASVNNNVDLETNTIWTDFASKHSNLLNLAYPLQLFNIWWSMPCLLNPVHSIDKPVEKNNHNPQQKNFNVSLELEAMANAADAFSLSDYYSHINPDPNTYITAQPWCYPEEHSVSEKENSDYYNKAYEVTSEICQTMVTSSIETAQDVLRCDRKTDISFPGMTLHRQRDRVVSRHNSLTSFLNASAVLDRRALALDYWPSCRTICRMEKSKNGTSTKRNNRFCHYLKSLSVLCKSDTFDNLCHSLCSNEGNELNINNCNE